jgi:hypothetical protein
MLDASDRGHLRSSPGQDDLRNRQDRLAAALRET